MGALPDQRFRAASRRQRGAVVLLFLLLAVSGSAFVMLKALNETAARDARQRYESTAVLNAAKRALIGYAVSYADGTHALGKGPGHLPCPDHDPGGTVGSSDAVPDCTLGSSNETGRFPWRTLGLPELRDGSGAPLWYAVSDAFRSNASPPLNSDTAAGLAVDARTDVVAVVIAPGEALAGQARTTANDYDPAAWLEDANASVGDGVFASAAPGAFNDVVLALTRAELMAAVERTVVTEVANALDAYFADPDGDDVAGNDPDCGADPDCDDGYPWLATFDNPATSDYAGVVGTLFGHLPLVRAGVAYDADFVGAWDVAAAGTLSGTGAEQPSDDCVRNTACFQQFAVQFILGVPILSFPVAFPASVSGTAGWPWSQGTCTTSGPDTLVCTATYDFTAGLFALTRDFRRVYTLSFTSNTQLQPPTAGARRTLAVQASGAWSGAAATLTVADYERPSLTEIGRKSLTFATLAPGDDVALTGVPYDLEVSDDAAVDHAASPGELPNWLFANAWHRHLVVRYATAESPGDAALNCSADGSCLTVNVQWPVSPVPVADAGVRGVVLAAGPDLSGNRPSASVADYLEGENATVDTTFDALPESAAFNDRLVTLPLQRP